MAIGGYIMIATGCVIVKENGLCGGNPTEFIKIKAL